MIHYVPFPDQETGFAWLVLARSIDNAATPLKAVASDGWQEKVRPEDREYLRALMEEWMKLRGQPAKSLFQHVDSLSTGPVRGERRGHSTFSALDREATSLLVG